MLPAGVSRRWPAQTATSPDPQALEVHWGSSGRPLPLRILRQPLTPSRYPPPSVPVGLPTGPTSAPFDFTGHIQRLCADIVAHCPEFAHIDLSRILFSVTWARKNSSHGLQARVTPLRFAGGRLTCCRQGVTYQVQRYFVEQREILYLVTFCLPRFLDQSFRDKLVTLFHELYHISPACDGDLRRHQGRYTLHTHSQRRYDGHMGQLVAEYLSRQSDPTLRAFLHLNFMQLVKRHGGLAALVVPRPKIIPLLGPR
jgi:hypothetical protein